jgi:hypothetical protein
MSAESNSENAASEKEKDAQKAEAKAAKDELAIALYYDPSANPEGASYPGVPLRHLSKAELEAQPAWIQKSIQAAPFYSAKPPKKETK